jgi:transcriptional regulator with XRE-family HTH domain
MADLPVDRQPNAPSSLGQRFDFARRVTGDNQTDLARKISQSSGESVAQSTISAYLRGAILRPSPAIQRAIEEYCREAELMVALRSPDGLPSNDAAFQAAVASLTNEPVTGDKQAELVRSLFEEVKRKGSLDPQRAAILSFLAKFLGMGELVIPQPDGSPATGPGRGSTAPLVAFVREAGRVLDEAAASGDAQTALQELRELRHRTMDAMLTEAYGDARVAN